MPNQNVSDCDVISDCYVVNPLVYLATWSFVISGAMFAVPCCLLAFVSFLSQKTKLKHIKIATVNKNSESSGMSSKILSKLFVCCTMMFTFFYAITVGTFLQYLQTFATSQLGWEVKTAALLNVVVGGSIVAGRVVAMFISVFLESMSLIAYSLAISLVGITVSFAVSLGHLSTKAMWTGSFLIGFGLAPIVSCSYVWTHQIAGLSAVQSSIISAGILAGFGLGPMTTSALLKTFGYMAMMYILFAFCIMQIVIYIALFCLNKKFKKLRNY